jgi:integrase
LCGIAWRNITLDGDYPSLKVDGSVQRIEGKLRRVPPKTDRGYRTIPLPAWLVRELRKHRREQAERRLLAGAGWREGDFVLEQGDGRPIDPDNLTHAFADAAQAAGARGFRLHDLRHGFATELVRAGVHDRVVSDVLGHARVSFTLQTYFHPDEKMRAVVAEAIDTSLARLAE